MKMLFSSKKQLIMLCSILTAITFTLTIKRLLSTPPNQKESRPYKPYFDPLKEPHHDIINGLNLKGNESVLDLACKDGNFSDVIAEKVPNGYVVGVDHSVKKIQYAQEKYKRKNLKFSVHVLETLDLKQKFDVIVSLHSMHSFRDQKSILKQAKKHLKPGGMIYFAFLSKWELAPHYQPLMEIMAEPKWAPYFSAYTVKYYSHKVDQYMSFLIELGYQPHKLSVRLNPAQFNTEKDFKTWLSAWLYQLEFLPASKQEDFLTEFTAKYVKAFPKNSEGKIRWVSYMMEVQATNLEGE